MSHHSLREKIHEIIFEAETPAGRLFDIGLLIFILLSISAVILESVPEIAKEYSIVLRTAEWFFTICFTAEYFLRIYAQKRPSHYIFSFFGIIDLVSTLPAYLQLFIGGSQAFLIIRVFRLLRIFRILKLGRYLGEANILKSALISSREKVIVFLGCVLSLILLMATAMYLVEGAESGFDSIPKAIYWAIVTMTTVGYGDIVPATVIGKTIASVAMILGYCIIAVPTGIVSAELSKPRIPVNTRTCQNCSAEGHLNEAVYCFSCGNHLA